MTSEDTIVAIATPPGRGGIGVVRLSGEQALEIASQLLRSATLPPEVQRSTVSKFLDPQSGKVLDEVVLTFYRNPQDRKSTRLNSSHMSISYAVFCLKKKNKTINTSNDYLLS